MAGTKRGGRKGRMAAAAATAGEDKRCSVKRKASGSGAKAGACEASPATPSLDVAALRKSILADLLAFPEAAVLDGYHLEKAVDMIIKEYKPETATPTAKGMVRLDDHSISMAFIQGSWSGLPPTEDLPPMGGFQPGWLDERRRQLDEEVLPKKRGEPDSLRLLLAKIRVELPELYYEITPPKAYARSPPKHATTAVVV